MSLHMINKMAHKFSYASITLLPMHMKQCITQPKKLSMGKQAWEKTCIDFKWRPKK
jgi:hypothetical protein